MSLLAAVRRVPTALKAAPAAIRRTPAFLKRQLAPRALYLRGLEFAAGPTDGSGAALFRIGFGLLTASVALWTALNAVRWFSNTGVMVARGNGLKHSLYRFAPDAAWMPHLHVALLTLGAVMLLVGLRPRIGAFIVFVAHTSLQHRTSQILNSGDRLFAILALLAVTMPLGHRVSIDAWWRARRGKKAPPASMWGQRLVQIQIAYVYGSAVSSKLFNARWLKGKALHDVLASPVFAEWPAWIDFWPIIYAMTWGSLVFEMGFPVFVWFRKLRPWVLLAGVAFHVGIDLLMIIPMFSWIMIVSYAAFLDDDMARRFLPKLKTKEAPETLRSAVDAQATVVDATDVADVAAPNVAAPNVAAEPSFPSSSDVR